MSFATYEDTREDLDSMIARFAEPGLERRAVMGVLRALRPQVVGAVEVPGMGRPSWFERSLELLEEHESLASLIQPGPRLFELREGVPDDTLERIREHLKALPRRRGYTPRT